MTTREAIKVAMTLKYGLDYDPGDSPPLNVQEALEVIKTSPLNNSARAANWAETLRAATVSLLEEVERRKKYEESKKEELVRRSVFKLKEEGALSCLPPEFRAPVSHACYESGHVYGYDAVLGHIEAVLEWLPDAILVFEKRVRAECSKRPAKTK